MSWKSDRHVDILDVSDLRFPGGTSHSIAEEIRAQSAAGWVTGLLHLNGPLVTRVTPVNPQLARLVEDGRARLLVGRDPVHADVIVIRHPAVLQHAADQLPPIHTLNVVIVANAGPLDIDGYSHYDPAVVDQIARERFGVTPVWAPIGPLVRDAIAPALPTASLLEADWVNIIEVDRWVVERPDWRSDRPVIGRHSRSSPQKWPSDPVVMRAAYPIDGSMTVRVLGGARPAEAVLGKLPPSWEVAEFGSQAPRDFLGGLDFFVYYHDPRWIEAFGRTILEALASGIPAILPPHFETLFGEAALYAEPQDVGGVIASLYADRAAYLQTIVRAHTSVRARFGHEAHVARVAELIGPPPTPGRSEATAVEPTPVEPTHAPTVSSGASIGGGASRPRILFITSNGAGMGHLTRLLAYARRTAPDLEPHFLSLSQAVGVVKTFGFGFEYLPSTAATGMTPKTWNPLFVERVVESIDRLHPGVVVFDGTWPYAGIETVREKRPKPPWVWSRRGMWRAGMNRDQLAKTEWFDGVLEPGDFAFPYDRGTTVEAAAHRVGPVTLLDQSEIRDRKDARRALRLDPQAPMALLSLGAGNINDTSHTTGAAVAALRRLGVHICVTQAEIAQSGGHPDDVHVIRDYPLSQNYRAFDLAVSATGYNSFHELLRFAVPTLFVPNRSTSLDDQEARARYAADHDLGRALNELTPETGLPLLEDLLTLGPALSARMEILDPGNGAQDGATYLATLAEKANR